MGRPAQWLTPWTIILVLVLAVLQARPVATEGSAALASSRVCLLAGGVLDFYSQNTGLPQCLRNGLCPAGSVQAHSQCVAPEEASGSREIGITMQLGCDMNCVNNEGVDTAATIWLALSRLLRVPLQESHASLLMMSSALRERYPLEYFTLHISGEEQLQTLVGKAKNGMAEYDLFLTVRIHTGRIGAAANELRQLLAGDVGNLAHISGASHETMHMFAMQDRRSNGPVRGLNGLLPNFKIKGYNWNERPEVANPGPAPSPPKYSPPTPPAYTPAPPPQPTASPKPKEGCSKDCQPSMIGDGRCDTECQNVECSWDAGDCLAPPENGGNNGAAVDLPGCGCEAKWLGNGKCETFCNYDACKFDGGDCASSPAATNAPLRPPAPAPAPRPTPAPAVCGCNEKWIGDGICDSYCNTAGCNYDGGDCPRPWNAPPAPSSPKTPAPPSYSNPVPAPVPAPRGPSPAAHSAPTPAPAAVQQPAPAPSPPPQTKVVDMHVEDEKQKNPDSQEAAGWRIVGAREDGSTFYADGGGKSDDDDDEAGPFMTAAVIAIFFAATGLLAVTAICILVRKTKPPPSKHRAVTPKFNVFMEPTPGGAVHANQVPAFSTKASQEASQQRSSSSSSAPGKKAKAGKASTYGRQQSKESSNSQETQSTTSTETPPSNGNGTPGSSCSGEHDAKSGKRWEKEPKVHPEPDPAPPPLPNWHRNSPSQQRRNSQPPEVQRGVSKDSPQRRHAQPPEADRGASKESPQRKHSKAAEVDRGSSKDSPQRHNPRTPEVDREASKEAAQQQAQASPAQARRASAPPAPRQEPKVQPAAANTGPRAAAQAESPPQPSPETNRGRQKAAGAANYSRWKFGLNSSSSKAAPPAEPSPKAKPPQRSQSSPPASASGGGSWFGGGASGPSKEEKAVAKKANSLSADMMHQLDHSRSKSLDERKKVFKDLQRQLHPDKNIEQAEAAKQAFQKLMEQRGPFLAS